MHNGTIDFTTEEGKGTTFNISLNKNNAEHLKAHLQKNAIDTNDIKAGMNEAAIVREEAMLAELGEIEIGFSDLKNGSEVPLDLISEKRNILIIDDDKEVREYLAGVFSSDYRVHKAEDGDEGLDIARGIIPDLIITDIVMKNIDGISLCNTVKEENGLAHIPVIVLSGSGSDETHLLAITKGADDFVKKPFDIDILKAKVKSLLKRRNVLQEYFFNEVTLGAANIKVSAEYKEFIEKCINTIEQHLQDEKFSIKIFAQEMGMSHSNLYKKIKAVSGQSIAGFIRYIRLKKAAENFINTEMNVSETSNMVGYYDVKHFRNHFQKIYGLSPSEYIKKYRKQFHNSNTFEKPDKKNL